MVRQPLLLSFLFVCWVFFFFFRFFLFRIIKRGKLPNLSVSSGGLLTAISDSKRHGLESILHFPLPLLRFTSGKLHDETYINKMWSYTETQAVTNLQKSSFSHRKKIRMGFIGMSAKICLRKVFKVVFDLQVWQRPNQVPIVIERTGSKIIPIQSRVTQVTHPTSCFLSLWSAMRNVLQPSLSPPAFHSPFLATVPALWRPYFKKHC